MQTASTLRFSQVSPISLYNEDGSMGYENFNERVEKATYKARILVVEDNLVNQKVAKLFLENLGYEVDIASSGQEVLSMSISNYLLILMDVGLPDMDGLELTRQIRARERNARTPIIACTANGEGYREKCLAAGMDDFILKPVMLNTLNELVEKFLV